MSFWTSAPASASFTVAEGPLMKSVKSKTFTPANGPFFGLEPVAISREEVDKLRGKTQQGLEKKLLQTRSCSRFLFSTQDP